MDKTQKEVRDRLYDYHKHNLVYIGDYIKFADQKAGVAITINIALIGFYVHYLKGANLEENILAKVFLILGIIGLLLSIITLLFKVLWPRYSSDKNLYMSWGGISAFDKAQDYSSVFSSINEEDFIKDMETQNYEVAKVCMKKYKYLKLGFIFLSIGTLVSSIAWFFDK